MSKAEFKPWPKIGRENPLNVVITEKIDGTNACIIIQNGEIVGVQSRKRFITPDDDNYGFAQWVQDNQDDLLKLGDGYHYGEWAGEGIQKNPLQLKGKHFFLFNVDRWRDGRQERPKCCDCVPVLYEGQLVVGVIENLLCDMKEECQLPNGRKREGVVVYHRASRTMSKHTVKTPKGKWATKD